MKWAQIGNPDFTQAFHQARQQKFVSEEADKSREFQARDQEARLRSNELRTGLMIRANQEKVTQVAQQKLADQTITIHSADEINRAVRNSDKDHLLSIKQPPFTLASSAHEWQGLITKGLKDIESSTMGKQVDKLNMVERGEYMDITGSGVLSNKEKAIQLDALFNASNDRQQSERPERPTSMTAAEKNLESMKNAGAIKTPEDEINYWKTVVEGKAPYDSVTQVVPPEVTPGQPSKPAVTEWSLKPPFRKTVQEASPATDDVTNKLGYTIHKRFKSGTEPTMLDEMKKGSSSEVLRVTPDGKTAIFDAETKKFIRYAD